ncbi:sugar ABC transporter substrate-binding protein [Pontimonas sp.]|nr:sugar ABC transporter substrate-binding protein [Pontimonas sp.]MDA9114596.1 sugar ABC transporter substrate-binding protein [Pontimonas sp.]
MRNSRIGLATASLIAVAGLTLSGCAAADETEAVSTESAEETATTAGDTYEVYALLPQGNDQPYGTTYLPPMEAKAAELGINLTITNSEYDGDKQASECEVAVAAQPDGIILWPALADTIRPCLEAANAAGIPVWITNADVNPEDTELTYGYSGTDSYGQGAASAKMMCEFVGDNSIGIIQINGLTGNSVATLRGNGFKETIASTCPDNVEILAEQPGNWNKDESQIAASEMLTAVGVENVGGMYAADDSMVAGGIDAFKARDLDPKDYIITSIGNTFLGNPLVASGELMGTVFQSSSWDGENAVVGIYRAMTGDTSLGRDDDASVLYMPNPTVTIDNWDAADVTPEW